MMFLKIFKSRFFFSRLLAWVLAAGAVLAGLAYYLSKDDETPRCPYCKGFVKRYARKCKKCNAKLGWE